MKTLLKTLHMATPGVALLATALLATGPAWALYKVVGPDGRVTYTDRPPPTAPAQPVSGAAGRGAASPAAGLPFTVRQAVERYPVTLYTSATCAPCDSARGFLKTRGVPFSEITVNTPAEQQAFQARFKVNELPLVRMGSKVMSGFAQGEWRAYLDAAGYPVESQLPVNYTHPAARTWAAAEGTPAGSAAPANGAESGPATSPPVPVAPPPGIRF